MRISANQVANPDPDCVGYNIETARHISGRHAFVIWGRTSSNAKFLRLRSTYVFKTATQAKQAGKEALTRETAQC